MTLLVVASLLTSCRGRTESNPNGGEHGPARAEQAVNSCSPQDASPAIVEALRHQYTPWESISWNEVTGIAPAYLFTPQTVPVTVGQSGNHTFRLTWRTGPVGGDGPPENFKAIAANASPEPGGTCLYRGSGSLAQSATCQGNGTAYRLLFCTTEDAFAAYNCGTDPDACAQNSAVLGATSVPHGGLLEGVTYLNVDGFSGDRCASTEATLTLTSPPDANGDGIPECLQGDGVPPSWPAGSTASATRTGPGIATAVWTAAIDNVGVAGYRLYHGDELIRELDAATLTATVVGLATEVVHTFRVQAFDAAGNASTDGPTATIRLDGLAPTWPPASTLTASPGGASSATLAWTAALDNVAVSGYRVYQAGQLVREVPAATLTWTVTGLPSDVVLEFTVQAIDADGNESADGPSATLLLDGSPPTWPPGSILSVTSTGAGSATLVWTAAIDNVAVSGYRVLRDGELVTEVGSGTLTATVAGLLVETTYDFSVEAFDDVGHVTDDGPHESVRLDGLAPAWPPGSTLSATPSGASSVFLLWTAAADNVAIAGYRLYGNGQLVSELGAGTLTASVSVAGQDVTFQVEAFDEAGNVSSDGPIAVWRADRTPPVWPTGSSVAATATGPRSLALQWTPATDDVAVTEYRIVQGAVVVRVVSAMTTSVTLLFLDPGVSYQFRVDAVDGAGQVAPGPATTFRIGTIDPALVAPPLDPLVSTTLFSMTEFLYTGSDPIQVDVTPAAISHERVALLRGRVLNRDGSPIRDVRVGVVGHPELGFTRTRIDGWFDVVVNGGGPLTLEYMHPEYFVVHRTLSPDWETTLNAEDVVLTRPDPIVTEVVPNAPYMQVARGSAVEDGEGPRQVTVLIPAATGATMVRPDGTTATLETLHVRATEYTVGEAGPRAMPADLPKATAYTYAVEFQVDEAEAAAAGTVRFSQPVYGYVDNFLEIPTGAVVPAGSYDRRTATWIAEASGVCLKILGKTSGLATIDANGDGAPDTLEQLAALGISDGERFQLANLYDVGKELWRVPMSHFSTHDWNLAWAPDGDATNDCEPADNLDPLVENGCIENGSIIECENQTLGEAIGIPGTGLSLRYSSLRTHGRSVERTMRIPVIGARVPQGLRRIEIDVYVAGQHHHFEHGTTASQTRIFTWDGKDSNGRLVYGSQTASVIVSYVYGIVYRGTPVFGRAYTAASFSKRRAMQKIGDEVRIARGNWVRVGGFIATPDNSIGGWTVSAQHRVEHRGHEILVHRGDGGLERKNPPGFTKLAIRAGARSVAAGPDGRVFYADNSAVWAVRRDGAVQLIGGVPGLPGFAGDGGPAIAAKFNDIYGLAVGPDGSLYIHDGNNHRIRRIGVDGIITTIAGNGTGGTAGDGLPATQAQLRDNVRGIAVGSDGSVYINSLDRVRKVSPDGIIYTLASGFGGGIAIAAGPEDEVYFLDTFGRFVWRIRQNGQREHVAGIAPQTFISGDGGPARSAGIAAVSIAAGPDGSVYLAEEMPVGGGEWLYVIRRIDPTGIISRFIGSGADSRSSLCTSPSRPLNVAPLAFGLCNPDGIAIGPGNTFYIAEPGFGPILRLAPTAATMVGSLRLAARSGAAVFDFDEVGRHRQTLNSMTGVAEHMFSYGSDGKLERIEDPDGNVVRFEYAAGRAWITAPFGQRTELAFNSAGYLESVTDAIGESVTLTYDANPERRDLLTSFAHPFTGKSTFTYDDAGRLVRDTAPGGGYKEFQRLPEPGGRKVTKTTRLGRNSAYVWTRGLAGITRRITDAAGLTAVVTEDNVGKTRAITPDGTVTDMTLVPDARFGQDAEQLRIAKVTFPSGRSLRTDVTDNVVLANPLDPMTLTKRTVTSTVNGARPSKIEYNAALRTVTATSAAGRQARVVVDPRGRPVDIFSPGVLPIHYEYDARGRVREVRQGARVVTITHDSDGRVKTVTGPDGKTVEYAYDTIGRPVSVTRPDGRTVTLAYERHGRRSLFTPPGRLAHVSELNPEARTTDYRPPIVPGAQADRHVEFDDDELLAVATFGAGAAAQQVRVVRDNAGRAKEVHTPRGIFAQDHDALGRTSRVSTPEGVSEIPSYDGSLVTGITVQGAIPAEVSFGYDTDLRLNGDTVNGSVLSFGYDADNLLTSVGELELHRDPATGFLEHQTLGSVTWTYGRNEFGEIDDRRVQAGGVDVFRSEVLERDLAGRIKSKRESVAAEVHVYEYEYDVLGRLTDVIVDGEPQAHYDYDENGNRTHEQRDGLAFDGRVDAQDRLTDYGPYLYAYTGYGALEETIDTRSGATTYYQIDLSSNLLGVILSTGGNIEYIVDAQNRRVGRKLNGIFTHRWVYGNDLGPAAEVDGAGNVVTRFVYGSRPWTPDYIVRAGTVYALVSDALGSVRLVVDTTSGQIVQRLDYDAYGHVLEDTNPGFQSFGFAGGLYDAGTGLTRIGARDYDATTGRWTSKDPSLFAGGLNVYAYANADPINFIDPTGLDPWSGDTIWESRMLEKGMISREELREMHLYQGIGAALGLLGLALAPEAAALAARVASCGPAAGGATGAVAELGRKLDFFLGQATGSAYNVQRSTTMLSQLERIGLPDNFATRAYLAEYLTRVLNNPSTIVRIEASGRTVRESLLMGPLGGLKFETIWEANKLITGILYGGRQ